MTVFMRLAYNRVYSCSQVVVRLFASDEFLYYYGTAINERVPPFVIGTCYLLPIRPKVGDASY
jgi:hypothetical protein